MSDVKLRQASLVSENQHLRQQLSRSTQLASNPVYD